MLYLALAVTAVVSYLLGSCNSSIIVVRLLKHEDIREHGSKNAGLTNTLRCYGKVPALLTLIGDLGKGVIAAIISLKLCELILGADFENVYFIDERAVGYISGMFSILGHIFPIYYGFKGGKGVLVSCSILLVIDPITFCIVIPFFILVVAISRYVSLGSILAAVAYPIITFFVHNYIYKIGMERSLLHTGLVVGTSILLIYMHRSNIQRLRNGTENKFGSKKKTDVMNDSVNRKDVNSDG
ncbi:MAG: glycerol-3-phosphate 1-O-acyltransferase PlsY [Huintestinicola sp.]